MQSLVTLCWGVLACRGGWLARTKQRNTSVMGLSESDGENVSCRGPVSQVPKRGISGLTVSQVPKRAVYSPLIVFSLSVFGDNRLARPVLSSSADNFTAVWPWSLLCLTQALWLHVQGTVAPALRRQA